MNLEQRIARAERILKMVVRSGRHHRDDFREKINILIAMQMKDDEEYRARHREMDERINEQRKETDKRIEALTAEIYEALDRLAARQAKTDEALERFLKERNGNSSD